jgi:F0F1-type ATP synthase membrane subunit b/b'
MKLILSLPVFWLCAFYANFSLASDALHHEINWWGLGSKYKDAPALGWLTITFLIFVYFLVRAIKKPLGLYLETRSKDIANAILEGQRAKEESVKKLKHFEEKLASLNSEIAKLRKNFMELAEAEKLEKMRQAKETTERIIKNTKDTIKANFERSKSRLAEEVIKSAVVKAKRNIMEQNRTQADNYLKTRMIADMNTAIKEVEL